MRKAAYVTYHATSEPCVSSKACTDLRGRMLERQSASEKHEILACGSAAAAQVGRAREIVLL